MSNPAERVSIPGVSAERSAEYHALTPRHVDARILAEPCSFKHSMYQRWAATVG